VKIQGGKSTSITDKDRKSLLPVMAKTVNKNFNDI
jgi:hypothetical protein